MSTHDNAAPLDGWVMPTRCCGEWSSEFDCRICGNPMPTELRLPPSVVLGEN